MSCLPAISRTRRTAIATSAAQAPGAFCARPPLACAALLPVSDDKISFEYKLKRFLQARSFRPDKAHVFWNGTFSEDEKRHLFRFADEGAHGGNPERNGAGPWLAALSSIRSAVLPARRHTLQSGPHEHGALAGGASTVPRPAHCGFCRFACPTTSNFAAPLRSMFCAG